MIPIPELILNLSSSMAASKKQDYFPRYFGGKLGEQGEITELFQKLLLCSVASQCIQQLGGNLIEIGAAEGKASVALSETARVLGKRLLVVDPYDGQQEGTEALYQQFLQATAPYKDSVTHLRESSLTDKARAAMKDYDPSFVFIDGLHHEWAAYSDIRSAHAALPVGGWICVDDTNHLQKDAGAALARAANEGLFGVMTMPEVEPVLCTYKSWHFAIKL